MKFGEERVDDAEGLILAHSLRLPAAMLKKGRVLTAEDVRALKQARINFVTGARLEEGDVGENEAAGQLAAALAGPGTVANAPFSGRCNLFAAVRGVVVIDRDRLDRLNMVDEAIAVATVVPYGLVASRQLVATVKIIPFGVDHRVIDTCAAFASTGGPLISVRPFQPKRVALILSTLPGLRDSVVDAAAAVTRARVAAVDGTLVAELRCNHDVGSLERALGKALAAGAEMVLVSGASATLDRRDVVPAAIVRAGGSVDHFGMPVDPGNLMLLARIGAVPVVDMPGCARSPKPNGLDWVLARLAAGLAPRPADIMRMGAGGLLKGAHPLLQHEVPGALREARVAAVILAAGSSQRMGVNKLLKPVEGRPMVTRAAEAALAAGLSPVVVVTGFEADEVEEALPTCDVQVVRNPRFAEGMGASLARGIAALPEDADAVVVLPADMPRIGPAHLGRLCAAFDPDEGRAICVPVYKGRRGNPLLFGRQFFAELAEGSDTALTDHGDLVFEVVMDDDAILTDVDTPEDYRRMGGVKGCE